MATVPKQRRTREIEYPTGDGKPVAETGLHVRELLGTFETLDDHFAGHPNVFVGANMFEIPVRAGSVRRRFSSRVSGHWILTHTAIIQPTRRNVFAIMDIRSFFQIFRLYSRHAVTFWHVRRSCLFSDRADYSADSATLMTVSTYGPVKVPIVGPTRGSCTYRSSCVTHRFCGQRGTVRACRCRGLHPGLDDFAAHAAWIHQRFLGDKLITFRIRMSATAELAGAAPLDCGVFARCKTRCLRAMQNAARRGLGGVTRCREVMPMRIVHGTGGVQWLPPSRPRSIEVRGHSPRPFVCPPRPRMYLPPCRIFRNHLSDALSGTEARSSPAVLCQKVPFH